MTRETEDDTSERDDELTVDEESLSAAGTLPDGALVVRRYTELHNDARIAYLEREAMSEISWQSILLLASTIRAFKDGHWIFQSIAIWLGAFLTWSYAFFGYEKVGVNLAQSTIVTLACHFAPHPAAPTGVGAYVGMGSPVTIPNFGWLALVSLIACGVWRIVTVSKLFVGYGGRLGFTSFCANLLVQVITAMPSGSVSWKQFGDSGNLWSQTLTWEKAVVRLVSATIAATLAKLFRDYGGPMENPVTAAASTQLLLCIIVSVSGWQHTSDASAGIGVGGFVGMAGVGAERLPSTVWFAIAGLLAGGVLLFLDPFFDNGWSGFQGTCALFGCLATFGVRMLWDASSCSKPQGPSS